MSRHPSLRPNERDRFPAGPALDYPVEDPHPGGLVFVVAVLLLGGFLCAMPVLAYWLSTVEACR